MNGHISPTLAIFTETKKSRAELIQTTLEILSAGSGCMYTENQIITLVLFETVCEEVESEYVPSSLVCNIHRLMKMQRKVKELLQVIYGKIGNNEINIFTLTLISKVNLFHSRPLDASNPSLIKFLQNREIDKRILMPLSSQKKCISFIKRSLT